MLLANLSKNSTIFVTGHNGMVGAAIMKSLKSSGYQNVLTRSHKELDLVDQQAVKDFFQSQEIDYVVLAAARVGGIHANNSYPAEFIYQNSMIQANVIHQAYLAGVKQLLFLGSACVYPKFSKQPIKEEQLLQGSLEPTNEAYGLAKILGIKFCESYNRQYGVDYRSIMPSNLYGPNDNFHIMDAHVVPSLIRKFHLARLVEEENIVLINKLDQLGTALPSDILDMLALSRKNNQNLVLTKNKP